MPVGIKLRGVPRQPKEKDTCPPQHQVMQNMWLPAECCNEVIWRREKQDYILFFPPTNSKSAPDFPLGLKRSMPAQICVGTWWISLKAWMKEKWRWHIHFFIPQVTVSKRLLLVLPEECAWHPEDHPLQYPIYLSCHSEIRRRNTIKETVWVYSLASLKIKIRIWNDVKVISV